MKRCRMLAVALVLGCACAAPGAGAARDAVYQDGFDDAASRARFQPSPHARWVEAEGRGFVLQVENPAPPPGRKPGTVAVTAPFDLRPYAGKRIIWQADIRQEGVTVPPDAWNGVKCMLCFSTPMTGNHWCNVACPTGSGDWTPRSTVIDVPEDVGDVRLNIGLQDSAGTVWVDNLKVFLDPRQRVKHPAPLAHPAPVSAGHDRVERLRGAMIRQEYNPDALKTLAAWGANLVRYQMTRDWDKVGDVNRDKAEFLRWIDGSLDTLDKILADCETLGLLVCIDLHTPPGGRLEDKSMRMFYEPEYADFFVEVWTRIAARYRGRPGVWGYDLINEPCQNRPSPEGCDNYWALQERAAKAIRAIDPDTAIIVEVDQWDDPGGFSFVRPMPVPGLVYQAHMYRPHAFTHQGVHGGQERWAYPGVIHKVLYDKEALRRELQPVRDFQLAYNVPVYIGEFSAIRWAEGADRYLKDVTDLFEEYGWDWSYHAFREWSGWSLEHGDAESDLQPAAAPPARQQVIRAWFAKNRKAFK